MLSIVNVNNHRLPITILRAKYLIFIPRCNRECIFTKWAYFINNSIVVRMIYSTKEYSCTLLRTKYITIFSDSISAPMKTISTLRACFHVLFYFKFSATFSGAKMIICRFVDSFYECFATIRTSGAYEFLRRPMPFKEIMSIIFVPRFFGNFFPAATFAFHM